MVNLKISTDLEIFAEEINTIGEKLTNYLREKKIYDKVKTIPFYMCKFVELGDISTPLPKILAGILERDWKEIGEDLISYLEMDCNLKEGFLNIKVDRNKYSNKILNLVFNDSLVSKVKSGGEKIIVEHTSVNPNKAMHIGHLRNSIIGDTIARFFKYMGYKVEVENYINDVGTQVADSYLAILKFKEEFEKRLEKESLEDILWDLYPKIYELMEKDQNLLNLRKKILKEMQEGVGIWRHVNEIVLEIIKEHLELLNYLNIKYDVLIRESSIIRSNIWEETFKVLREKGVIYKPSEGEYKGCWMLKLSDLEEFKGLKNADKVLVRSDGTVTYNANDIALTLWKFGIISSNLKFEKFFNETYITSEKGDNMNFGNGDVVINVIDIRQKYVQDIIKYTLKLLGFENLYKNFIHCGYEVVSLSLDTAKDFCREIKKESSFIHMSGRKGVGIKAKDFVRYVRKIIEKKCRERNITSEEVIDALAVASIRYEMISFDFSKVLVFDFKKATNFEGESGVYILYTYARAKSLLNNYKKEFYNENFPKIFEGCLDKLEEWKLVLEIAKMRQVFESVRKNIMNLDKIAKYTYELAKCFNEFYQTCPIIKESNDVVRRDRILLVSMFLKVFEDLLNILGFKLVDRI